MWFDFAGIEIGAHNFVVGELTPCFENKIESLPPERKKNRISPPPHTCAPPIFVNCLPFPMDQMSLIGINSFPPSCNEQWILIENEEEHWQSLGYLNLFRSLVHSRCNKIFLPINHPLRQSTIKSSGGARLWQKLCCLRFVLLHGGDSRTRHGPDFGDYHVDGYGIAEHRTMNGFIHKFRGERKPKMSDFSLCYVLSRIATVSP